jgi:hypothetical protein
VGIFYAVLFATTAVMMGYMRWEEHKKAHASAEGGGLGDYHSPMLPEYEQPDTMFVQGGPGGVQGGINYAGEK